jgi:hypothetical protein
MFLYTLHFALQGPGGEGAKHENRPATSLITPKQKAGKAERGESKACSHRK